MSATTAFAGDLEPARTRRVAWRRLVHVETITKSATAYSSGPETRTERGIARRRPIRERGVAENLGSGRNHSLLAAAPSGWRGGDRRACGTRSAIDGPDGGRLAKEYARYGAARQRKRAHGGRGGETRPKRILMRLARTPDTSGEGGREPVARAARADLVDKIDQASSGADEFRAGFECRQVYVRQPRWQQGRRRFATRAPLCRLRAMHAIACGADRRQRLRARGGPPRHEFASLGGNDIAESQAARSCRRGLDRALRPLRCCVRRATIPDGRGPSIPLRVRVTLLSPS